MRISSNALLVNDTRILTEPAVMRGKSPTRAHCGPITRRRRTGGSANRAQSAATVGCIVRYNDARQNARWHAVVAVSVAFVVLISATGWKLTEHEHPAHHGPHVLTSSIFTDSAAVIEHPHVQDGSVPITPDTFAEAPLPRTATLLVAIGLVAVIGAAFSWWATGAPAVIRGPPRRGGSVAGQQLLLRLCIARR